MSKQIGSIATEKKQKSIEWRNYTSAIGLILLVIISSILSDNFITPINIVNILKQIVTPACLAIGMTYVIITAGIDLTVGSIIALLATTTGIFLASGMHWILAVLLIMIIGFLIGAFHGTLVSKLNIPPYIATLAGYTAYKGLALLLTNSAAIRITEPTFLAISSKNIPVTGAIVIIVAVAAVIVINTLTQLKKQDNPTKSIIMMIVKVIGLLIACIIFVLYGGLPINIAIVGVLIAIFSFILSKTVFGAEVYAIGGNKVAAKLAGINVDKRLITVYAISTLCAAIGALLTASRLGSGALQSGMLAENDAIAAGIIGGTSMSGGVGKLSGTMMGVALIGVLNNMLSLLGVSSYTQQIAKGLIILLAVLLDMQLSKRASK